MKQLLLSALLLSTCTTWAQTEFFRSPQTYTKDELKDFYSSFTVQNTLLLFNASDYKLYAFNTKTGTQTWVYNLGRKSDYPPYLINGRVWANANEYEAVQIDSATGKLDKVLPFSVLTKPMVRDSIIYSTGIYELGSLYAYNSNADTVLWSRFLAHGCSVTPYYKGNTILANAEGNYWIEVTPTGALANAACEGEEVSFPSELSCARKFSALTHDGKELKGKLANALMRDSYKEPQVFTTQHNTFVLVDGQLAVLGNKLKKIAIVPLDELKELADIEPKFDSPERLLQADAQAVTLLYNQQLLTYNFKKKKITQRVNLAPWEPHQVQLQEDKIWLISEKDGRLYGLTL